MNIALIFPRYKYPSGDAPLGVSYLAAYLKKHSDCNVEIIDTTFHKDKDEIKTILSKKKYDLIGISVMTTMLNDGLNIAKYIKQTNPSTKVIFGGPHPTVMPETTLDNEDVDAVCIGEGELVLLDIAQKNGDFKDVPGVWYKDKGIIVKNKPNSFLNDLNDLPFPALDCLPIEKYVSKWFQLDSVATNLKGINIISSRGCPYKCTYCQPTLFHIFGNKVRKRSAENIVGELRSLKEKYGINAFMFQDDTFVFDKEWVKQVCDLMIKEKLDLVWGCNARANLVTEELFSIMKTAGLRKVFMGIESGSQRILDEIYDKRITLEQVVNAVNILNKLDIKIQGYFMMGAPTETVEEINKTISFSKKLHIDEATFSITTPLPATFLYDKTKELISQDITTFDYYKNPVYGKGISKTKINLLKKKALLSFYLFSNHFPKTAKQFLSLSGFKKALIKLKRF